MKIEQIAIKGYKSIKSLEMPLSNLNVLIGANGAGKSNFISVFRLLNEMYHQNLQGYTQERNPSSFLHFGVKNTRQIELEIKFDVGGNYNFYGAIIRVTQDNKILITSERAGFQSQQFSRPTWNVLATHTFESQLPAAQDKKISGYVRDCIGQLQIYHFHDVGETSAMKQPCASNDNLILKRDGENLAAYLKMLAHRHPRHYAQIVATIRLIAPFFGDFVLRDEATLQLEWTNKTDPHTPFLAHQLSDGTLRFIALATLLLQPFELMPHVIIIDEPELGLHPFALTILSELIKRASTQRQVIISSQSVELIDHFDAGDVIVAELERGASAFRRLDAGALASWLDDYSLGEAWKSNAFGGNPR